MAGSINKVILVGNLGNDPEVKYTQGGLTVTKASLATTTVQGIYVRCLPQHGLISGT